VKKKYNTRIRQLVSAAIDVFVYPFNFLYIISASCALPIDCLATVHLLDSMAGYMLCLMLCLKHIR
jgi:hypothetical protein